MQGTPIGKNVTAAKNSEDVINYISTHTRCYWFCWCKLDRWIEKKKSAGKVKMALIECKKCDKDTYAKPSQQTITFKQYPLVRGLYYVLKENSVGLGSGFINFLSQERGQLIFKRANLVPAKMQLYRRSTT